MTPDSARERIAVDLRSVGVRPGSAMLVHSSLSALGAVPGGADTVIAALGDALGDAGTLLMPALSYLHVDAARPVFDLRATPSNVGAIPERFRLAPGTLRSAHPTHSVCARGPLAQRLLADHHLDRTPCGPRSAFSRLRDVDGDILFIGCGLAPNTSMHAIEELVEPPYLFGDEIPYRVVLADGRSVDALGRRHGFRGWMQRYERVAPLLGGALAEGSVLAARAHLVRCRPLWDAALAALRADAFAFVERAQ
jgi:aminoglycoside 3-N-acetyltransferase